MKQERDNDTQTEARALLQKTVRPLTLGYGSSKNIL